MYQKSQRYVDYYKLEMKYPKFLAISKIWKRGAVYNVETNRVYSFSEAHGNERPGTKIGDLVSAPMGKLKKSTLGNLRYILGLED